VCLFFRQNGGDGVYQEKENLIPQAFNSFCRLIKLKIYTLKTITFHEVIFFGHSFINGLSFFFYGAMHLAKKEYRLAEVEECR
jgi:hypothetical protein